MDVKHGGPINLNSTLLREADLRSARLPAADLDRADLRGADLSHGHLNQSNLCHADLRAARLDHADLTGVELKRADLRGARLRSVNLTDADLRGANLSGADLIHARLNGANLAGANLSQAKLDHTDFATAKLKGANLAGASLYHAKNLTRVQLEETKLDECTLLPSRLSGTDTGSPTDASANKPRPRLNASSHAASPAAMPRPASLRFPWKLNRRVSWVVMAVLWTFVIIGVAMKQSSVAVALLPPAAPVVPELSLATAAGPMVVPAGRVFINRLREQPTHDMESAVKPPRVLAALSDPRLATRSTPAVIDEPTGKSPSIGMVLRANPLPQIGPDSAVEDIKPDILPAIREETRNLRVASLKQTRLRPVVTQAATVRLPDAPEDTVLTEGATGGPLTLLVSLRHQRLDVYRGDRLVETSEISSGMKDHETMAGVFSILDKRRYHHSNMYSNAPMPWMHRLTRSGTALHGGVVPGYPASHGCIRLPFSFATKLFHMTEVGMNVIVADDQIVPTKIAHRNLPQPASVFANVSKPQASLEPGDESVLTDASSTPPLRILVTRRTLRDRLISLQRTLSELGYLAPQNFTGKIGRQSTAAIKAFQKANDMPVTGKVSKELATAIYKAAGKDEPPAGHLFVRQGYKRLFDTPIAFSDPDRSLGTHVFTSMDQAQGETEIVWLGMSLEGGNMASALERLQFPDDLRQTLASALTPGSTLIIGDLSLDTPILPEGDDFIVLTKDVPEVPVAAATSGATKPTARKPTVYRHAKQPSRRVTREARRVFNPGSRNNYPRGLFSRW